MKTLKVLKQFFKQKVDEIWTILIFKTDHSIPNVIRRWVVTLVYGPIVVTIFHMLGYIGPYIGLPTKRILDHYLVALIVLCSTASISLITVTVYSLFFADLLSNSKGWITRNWRDAQRRVQDQQEKEKLK